MFNILIYIKSFDKEYFIILSNKREGEKPSIYVQIFLNLYVI